MKAKSRNDYFFTRREFVMAGSGFVLCAATGCAGENSDSPGNVKRDLEAKGTPWNNTIKAADLVDLVHMSDINYYGQFLEFGSASRFKSTLGGWMSGWSLDAKINGISYTWIGKSPARVYFSMPAPTDLKFVLKVKKKDCDYFSVYLNDKPLQRVSFKSSKWEEHVVAAEATNVLAGENYLKFIFKKGSAKIGKKPVSFAVDCIRIIPAGMDEGAPKNFNPPNTDILKQRIKAREKEIDALVVPTPISFSYYLSVPPKARLCFKTKEIPGKSKSKGAKIKVTALSVDKKIKKKLADLMLKDGWQDVMLKMDEFQGKLVRLDIECKGPNDARVVLGNLSLRTERQRIQVPVKKMKNVIILLVDTLRADKLGVYAKSRVKTPVMDRFTQESSLFERCQAPSNWTKPSCATVLTGLYPDTHKARGHSSKLPSSAAMVSQIFQKAGFATGAFIANGYLASEFGFNRGWNKYINFIREKKTTDAENVFKKSLEFIKENKDKPFFTYIQTIDPHVPYDPPSEYLKKYDTMDYTGPVKPRSTGNLLEDIKRKKIDLSARDKRRLVSLYDGEITYHDAYFGLFLDGLNELGVLDDTVFVVCSDHGEEFFDHGSVGHGHSLYQELLHVPLIIRAPGLVRAKSRLTSEVGLTDIVPTVLKATGKGENVSLEGKNLLPFCNGADDNPMAAGFSSFYSEADSRNLSWSVRKCDFKLKMRGPARTYLYNLALDPGEKKDVDLEYPDALRALRIALGQFIGAPKKRKWTKDLIEAQSFTAEAKNENTNIPEDLREQLQALGYMQ